MPAKLSEHHERILKLYSSKHQPFGDKLALASWYDQQYTQQNGCCYYCETPVILLRQLIEAGLLKTRAVRGGKYRGGHLEIDKQGDIYDPATCVLACYYCNNDKSYIFSKADYKQYFGEARKAYFLYLQKQLQ